MIRSTKPNDGQYGGKGRRRSDYSSHREYEKNHPFKMSQRHHHKKIKKPSLEHIAQWAIIGLGMATFTYLATKGYAPKMGHHGLQEMKDKYSGQYNPLKDQLEKIKTHISTKDF